MGEPKIKGGYVLLSRSIQESDIAHTAPCTRELWSLLIRESHHSTTIKSKLKRGQCFKRIDDIRSDLHWKIGFRKMMYTKRSIEGSLKVLRKRGMIKTMKVTRGMIITICKYDYYQDPKNYEGDTK
jgi:hypothetical protein